MPKFTHLLEKVKGEHARLVSAIVDFVVIAVSTALLAFSAVCALSAIRYAVTDTPAGSIMQNMEAAINKAAADDLPTVGGESWFMLPDGSFINGNNEVFGAPARSGTAAAANEPPADVAQ